MDPYYKNPKHHLLRFLSTLLFYAHFSGENIQLLKFSYQFERTDGLNFKTTFGNRSFTNTVLTHNKHTHNKHLFHNKHTLFAQMKMCLFWEKEDFGKINSLYFVESLTCFFVIGKIFSFLNLKIRKVFL